MSKLADSFLDKEESVLFCSMLMVSKSSWVVEKFLPVNLRLMWTQILSRVQIWTLIRDKYEPDGLVFKLLGCRCSVGRSIVLLKNIIWSFLFFLIILFSLLLYFGSKLIYFADFSCSINTVYVYELVIRSFNRMHLVWHQVLND